MVLINNFNLKKKPYNIVLFDYTTLLVTTCFNETF